MIFLFLLILTQTEYKILLKKKPPSISFSTPKSELSPSFKGKGDTLYIGDYWWHPDRIAYVTDIYSTGYAIESYDWNLEDTVFWYYYYPENDTQTGEPTGEYKRCFYGYVTYAYEDPPRCHSYWKYWGITIWDSIPTKE